MKPQLPRRKIPRARSGFGRPQCRPPECLEWGRKTSLLIFTFIIWFQILIVKRQSLGVYNAGPREEGKGTRHGATAGCELCFAFVVLVLFSSQIAVVVHGARDNPGQELHGQGHYGQGNHGQELQGQGHHGQRHHRQTPQTSLTRTGTSW